MDDEPQVAAMNALRAADLWLKLFVREMDIEPHTTTINVNRVSPGGEEIVARRTLAQSMREIEIAIEEAGHAPFPG